MQSMSKRLYFLFTLALLFCTVATFANAQQTTTAQYLYLSGVAPTGTQGRIASYHIATDGTLTQTQGAFPTSESVFMTLPSAHGARLFALGLHKLWVFSVNPTNGTITLLSSVVLPSNIEATSMALNPLATLLFVAKTVDQGGGVIVRRITTYRISPTGTLTSVASTVVSQLQNAMAVDKTGRFLYASVQKQPNFNDAVDAFSINTTTGDLTFAGETASALSGTGNSMAIHPTNGFLYEGMSEPGVSIFSRNATTGRLTFAGETTCFCDGGPDFGTGIALNGSGKILFQGTSQSAGVALYSVNQTNGQLTPLGNSFIEVPFGPNTFAPDQAHGFLYIRNQQTSMIDAYHISDTGAVTPTTQAHIPLPANINATFSMTVLAVK